ncbi:hypothetical protein ACFOY8_12340 [Thalassospira xianhensis]|uniref:Uncharacterized protein n=1 Tax=Thalassospira xianhensis MCCC 1A02616 TaxID=1177929 RepID=A0A367UDF0_9PROT|nr:hypothetical protein [Thalassospira xianhensis]RCK06347.1 hypothetical protein TH5_09100 [Thalassospira xianhensis MCCC 1A02616]
MKFLETSFLALGIIAATACSVQAQEYGIHYTMGSVYTASEGVSSGIKLSVSVDTSRLDITDGVSPGACVDAKVTAAGDGTVTNLVSFVEGGDSDKFGVCSPTEKPCGFVLAAGESCNVGIQLTGSGNADFSSSVVVTGTGAREVRVGLQASSSGFATELN